MRRASKIKMLKIYNPGLKCFKPINEESMRNYYKIEKLGIFDEVEKILEEQYPDGISNFKLNAILYAKIDDVIKEAFDRQSKKAQKEVNKFVDKINAQYNEST